MSTTKIEVNIVNKSATWTIFHKTLVCLSMINNYLLKSFMIGNSDNLGTAMTSF